jgi:hypothetical protein
MRTGHWTGLILVAAIAVLVTCGQQGESPRQRVLDFVRLIQADSLPDILPFIDADSVATYEYSGSGFDSLSLQQKKNRLINGFLRDGEYRRTWAKSQIVVNEEIMKDDTTAAVEVSFIDRATRIQYYSQMELKKRNSTWVICSFKVN